MFTLELGLWLFSPFIGNTGQFASLDHEMNKRGDCTDNKHDLNYGSECFPVQGWEREPVQVLQRRREPCYSVTSGFWLQLSRLEGEPVLVTIHELHHGKSQSPHVFKLGKRVTPD